MRNRDRPERREAPGGMAMRTQTGHALIAITLLALSGVMAAPARAADPVCEPAKLATKYPELAGKTIKVSATGTSKPYSYRDPANLDNIIGFGVDYARAGFACLGIPMTIGTADWSGLLTSVTSGQADVIWDALYATPERAKVLDFVLYQVAGSGGLVPKGNPKKLSSIDDLCGLRAVALIGTVEAVKAQAVGAACVKAGKPDVTVMMTPDHAAGLRLVENDRVDVYLGEATVVAYDKALFERAFIFSTGLKVGVGINKGNKVLEMAVYDAIKALQADGTATKLFEKYQIDPSLSYPAEIVTQ
jgi:polar amino acid transport system substrate-binding protein